MRTCRPSATIPFTPATSSGLQTLLRSHQTPPHQRTSKTHGQGWGFAFLRGSKEPCAEAHTSRGGDGISRWQNPMWSPSLSHTSHWWLRYYDPSEQNCDFSTSDQRRPEEQEQLSSSTHAWYPALGPGMPFSDRRKQCSSEKSPSLGLREGKFKVGFGHPAVPQSNKVLEKRSVGGLAGDASTNLNSPPCPELGQM